MKRFSIFLDIRTINALCQLAKREFRDPHVQAALIIQQSLLCNGFLEQIPGSSKGGDLSKDINIQP